MDHEDHVALLRGGVAGRGGTWADIGAGEGAFTLALAELLGPGGRIVAVDRDAGALAENARAVAGRFPGVELETHRADFERPMELPPVDGLVAANSLHFVARDRQIDVVRALVSYLRPGGAFVVVEYDADRGNPWVPYPLSFGTWRTVAAAAGLTEPRLLHRVPSRFLGAIYSAVSERVPEPVSAD